MNAHIDIHVIENPEVPCASLMGAVFDRIHRDIVSLGIIGKIAIDFPQASKDGARTASIGNVIRLSGEKQEVEKFIACSRTWRGLQGRFRMDAIVVFGPEHKVTRWVRYQPHLRTPAAVERMIRRRIARAAKNTETPEQLRAALEPQMDGHEKQIIGLHHLHITSASSASKFALFFKRCSDDVLSAKTALNSYGLVC
jgi:CRISPR-associated endonuclease Csy4